MKITKRDGREVVFDQEKISNAVLAAAKACDGRTTDETETLADVIAETIANLVELSQEVVNVEDIQDKVEELLMVSDRKDIARAYITYRNERTRQRERDSELMRQIGQKLNAETVENQNANVDERSFGGRMGEARSIMVKRYALDNLVSKKAMQHHDNNEIYIHDLDSYAVGMHNCARGTTWVQIKHGDKVEIRRIQDIANEIGLVQNQTADLSLTNMSILGRDGWTKLQAITRRAPQTDEELFVIKTNLGLPLELTADHRLPVIRDGKEVVLEVRDIVVGDELLTTNQAMGCDVDKNAYIDLTELAKNESIDLRIANARPLNDYLRYRYNVRLSELCESVMPNPQLNHAQLTVNDFLEVEKEYPIPFDLKMRLLVKANGSKHAYPMLIPVTPSLAKLYGYIYCDGSVYVNDDQSTWQLTFTNTNIDLMHDFCACYEEVFGYTPKIHRPSGNSPCYRVTDGSRVACELFHNFANARKTNAGNISLPDFIVNGSELVKYAYISAFIDTDGCMTSQRITFTTCAKTMAEQLMLILEGLGYHPSMNLAYEKGSTYHFGNSNRTGTRNFNCYSVFLARSDERKDLVAHTDTLKTADITSESGLGRHLVPACIKSIETMPLTEDVYDIQTATHWFIANNYVSHNCLSVPIDDLLANGFVTRQTDVRPAGSVKSALQLVAVIFQLQSLCQFGGVSATHLDWSMVPYVRKSFAKHYRDGMRYLEGDASYQKDGSKSIVDATYSRNKRVYEYALDMTIEETHQAVEAMYHNLNLGRHDGNVMNIAA